jgi:signal transduction histidine kinase
VQFVVAGLVMAAVLSLATGWLSRRAAVDEAITDAEATTTLLARSVVQPAVPVGLVSQRASAVDRFDRLVRRRVLVGQVLRVKVWDADGTIVYSDEPRLIGRRFDLGDEEVAMARTGRSASSVDAEVSDLSRPENTYERPLGTLLEVYTPIRSPEGEPLLFEAYYSYEDVTQRGSAIVGSFRPITVGGILLFLLLTVPLVWLLARRLADSAADRERLLLVAAQASDTERRRIARDLHDGVVQELAGASFTLSATARDVDRLDLAEPERGRLRQELTTMAGVLRANLRSLRSLLVEIYPPDLGTNGLAAAVDDLVGPAVAGGVEVGVDLMDTTELPDDVVALVWRAAQECVRNALRHGNPNRLDIALHPSRADGSAVLLEVADDGRGFDPGQDAPTGHLGLKGLHDLAREAGATLTVSSAPGEGTRVSLEVPAR